MAGDVTATRSSVAPLWGELRYRLGDLGLPGVFSSTCKEGECCASFRSDLNARIEPDIAVIAVHSRSEGIVDWKARLDPHAERVHLNSSHCGMSVHREVYEVLDRVLDDSGETAWSG